MACFARRLATLCVATAISCAAGNQDPWLRITSANFEVYTTGGERSGRDLARHFEEVRSFFLQVFGASLSGAKPVCIIAFRNEKEFAPYRPTQAASSFFHPGLLHDFIVMSNGSSDHYPEAIHEFTHMMVHAGGHEYPPWFNEGLADLFSNLQPVGNRIRIGQEIPSRMITLDLEKWIPLATLLAADYSSPYYNEKSEAGMFYAESWKLVHMLFLHPSYRPRLEALGGALKEGDTADALEALYHKRLDEIEADLRLYLRDGTINTMIFDIQLPKEVDTPEVETSAGLSARLALAEMLSNTRGRDGQAGAAYAALAREYPNRPEIEEGWGRLCGHQHKPGDAIRHYARAVELGGKDPRLFLEYSRILYISDRLADAIDTLEKAARLNPDNDEIRFELGSAYMQHGNYKEAAAELHTVKNVQPAHAYRYYYDMAFSEYRLGQTAEAKVHAAKARAVTNHPGELATLDGLDHALEAPAARADEAGPAIASATGDSAGATDTGRQGPAQASATPQDQTVSATPTVHSVEGILEHLECGEFARLHVRVDGRIRIFVITDSLAVNMRDRHGAPVYLQCGPQKPPRALRIEYQAQPGQPDAVRLLEFK